ncbi:hypothetical protein, partial [Rivihabitans pingtungensis]|uniref:hypothetical protein n=1 Tax=Rivihabitans pingtungensis TaxID=1054498 RepID=UPI001B85F0E8
PFFVADIGWVRFAVFHGAWILPLWDSSEQALGERRQCKQYGKAAQQRQEGLLSDAQPPSARVA